MRLGEQMDLLAYAINCKNEDLADLESFSGSKDELRELKDTIMLWDAEYSLLVTQMKKRIGLTA